MNVMHRKMKITLNDLLSDISFKIMVKSPISAICSTLGDYYRLLQPAHDVAHSPDGLIVRNTYCCM